MIQQENIFQQRKMLLESFKMSIDQSDISALNQYNQLIQSNYKEESLQNNFQKKQILTLSNDYQSINTDISSIVNSPQHQAIMNTFSKSEKMKSPQKKEFLSPQATKNTYKYESLIKKTFNKNRQNDSPNKVLFTMTIDMGHNNQKQIDVNSHEEPVTIARRFCEQNSLTQEAVTILAQNIYANKQQYLHEQNNQQQTRNNQQSLDQQEIEVQNYSKEKQKEQPFAIPVSGTKNKKVNQQQQKQIEQFIKKIHNKEIIPNNNKNLNQIDLQNTNPMNNNNKTGNNNSKIIINNSNNQQKIDNQNAQQMQFKQIIQSSSPKNILGRVINKHMKGKSLNTRESNDIQSDYVQNNINEDLMQLSQIKEQIQKNLKEEILVNNSNENNDQQLNVYKKQNNKSLSEISTQRNNNSYDKKLNMYFKTRTIDEKVPLQMFSPKINITKTKSEIGIFQIVTNIQ